MVTVTSTLAVRTKPWPSLVVSWLFAQHNDLTQKSYRRTADRWMCWCAESKLDPFDVLRVHADAWARSLTEYAPATAERMLATISSLYQYATEEGFLDRNPFAAVKRPVVAKLSGKRWLSVVELQAFVSTAKAHGPRDHLLALLLATSALRSEEVRELRIEEVGFTGTHTTILVHGKGDKPERVPVPASTASVLEDQIGNRAFGFVFTHGVQTDPYSGPYGQAHDPLPTVFDSEVDDIMSHDQLKRAVTRLSNRAGLNGKGKGGHVTPHCFRHSAITLALDVGVDLRDVEVFARHADGRTTRRYDRTRLNFERHASFALERAVVLQAD